MNTIIVDDERQSHEVLKSLLHEHPDFQLIGSAYGVDEGVQLVHDKKPDLIFLDVEMPDGTGFDLLKKIKGSDYYIVFITAHNKYAIKAIQFGALHYLLKPIERELLSEALNRVRNLQTKKTSEEQWKLAIDALALLLSEKRPAILPVSTMEGVHLITIKDIKRFEAGGNITSLHIEGKRRPILASVNLGKYVKQFSDYPKFIQVHRSHMVNLYFVEQYVKSDGGYLLMKDGIQIPVSRRYKDELVKRLRDLS